MPAAFVAPSLPLTHHHHHFSTSFIPLLPNSHSPNHSYPPRNRRIHPTLCESPTAPISPPSPSSQEPPPSSNQLSFSTAASSAPTLNAALTDATSRALANLSPGGPPNFALIFVSARYCVPHVGPSGRDTLARVVPKLRALVPQLDAVLGCTADGVIGQGSGGHTVEVEDGPGVSLTLARLPRIGVKAFHVMPDDLPSLDAGQEEWRRVLGCGDGENVGGFIVFSDAAFAGGTGLETFLEGVGFAYPGCGVVGGVASGGVGGGDGHLFCTLKRDVFGGGSLRDNGVVGVCLSGDVEVECLVSGGCRGVGPIFEVRKVEGGVLLEMEEVGRSGGLSSAVGCLRSVVGRATGTEKSLMQTELFVGVSFEDVGGDGDVGEDGWLIRSVLGVDMSGGGISIGRKVRVGQMVRFFVKERDMAQENLDRTMQKYKRVELANSLVGYSNAPFGAMVFVDAGRGRALFRERHMETRNLTSFASGVPVAGFFGSGQIGPCRTGAEASNMPAVMHSAANLIALVRRRSGLSPLDPLDSPAASAREIESESESEEENETS